MVVLLKDDLVGEAAWIKWPVAMWRIISIALRADFDLAMPKALVAAAYS